MPDRKNPCTERRERLLEAFLSAGGPLPPEVRRHMESCGACTRYWNALSAVRSAAPQGPLYSPFLRAKTLGRVAGRERRPHPALIPAMAAAAALSFAVSFALPGWLLAQLFLRWTASPGLAYGSAAGAMLAAGTLATVASAISLMERGAIGFGAEDGGQGRADLPPATGAH